VSHIRLLALAGLSTRNIDNLNIDPEIKNVVELRTDSRLKFSSSAYFYLSENLSNKYLLTGIYALGLTVYCLSVLQCTPSSLEHCSAVIGQSVQFSGNEVSDLFLLIVLC